MSAPPKQPQRARLGRVAPDDAQAEPATLPQFEHISRYWDSEHECFAARLLPGEYYVTRHAEIDRHRAGLVRLGLHPRCAPGLSAA